MKKVTTTKQIPVVELNKKFLMGVNENEHIYFIVPEKVYMGGTIPKEDILTLKDIPVGNYVFVKVIELQSFTIINGWLWNGSDKTGESRYIELNMEVLCEHFKGKESCEIHDLRIHNINHKN